MTDDVYGQVDKDYARRDFFAGVPRYFQVGRITQLTEPHKTKAMETYNPDFGESEQNDVKYTTNNMSSLQKAEKNWTEINTPHPLQEVFDAVIAQVSKGKGAERHGMGKEFLKQPWVRYSEVSGAGFAVGQSLKKMEEAQGFEDHDRWEQEMLGSIAYSAMAVLYRRMSRSSKND